MISESAIQQIWATIKNGKRFIITSHVNPDGDAIGSEIGFGEYLKGLGKEIHILNHSKTPMNCHFLDPYEEIELFDLEKHQEIVSQSDAIFILDISDWKRLKELGAFIQNLTVPKICIDHHPLKEKFVDLDVIMTKASSTGEIIHSMLKRFNATFFPKMAEALYTAIMTDTGSFRFSNTRAGAHKSAAELIEAGASPNKIYNNIYENQNPQRVKLFAHILENLKYAANGKVAWAVVTQDLMKKTKTFPKDTDGFADFPRSISGVEISIFFLETEDKKVKISFRSKSGQVINGLANRFGGGGHPTAAGAFVEESLDKTIPRVIEEACELF